VSDASPAAAAGNDAVILFRVIEELVPYPVFKPFEF
jgi:hypothetical protein